MSEVKPTRSFALGSTAIARCASTRKRFAASTVRSMPSVATTSLRDALAIVVVERSAEQCAQLIGDARVANRKERRQAVDPLGEILARGLAELAVRGGEIQDVVAQLVDHAKAAAELGQRFALFVGQVRRHRTHPTARGHERRGLALDGFEVVGLGALEGVGGAHFGDLAAGEPREGVGHEARRFGAEVGGDPRRTGHEVVARDDGDEVAVPSVHALDVAADLGLVHDVVVVEGGDVHQLERDAAHEVVVGRRALAARRGCDCQERAQALAAGVNKVGRDLVEIGVPEDDRFGEERLEPNQVLFYRSEP